MACTCGNFDAVWERNYRSSGAGQSTYSLQYNRCRTGVAHLRLSKNGKALRYISTEASSFARKLSYGLLYGSNNPGVLHTCQGSQKDTPHPSSPEEDSDTDQDSTEPKSYDGIVLGSTRKSDWRTFRARLVAREHALTDTSTNAPDCGYEAIDAMHNRGNLWAHPLHVPEPGCVLVATDKLDGQVEFERTVVLLLYVGSNQPREGPYGVILNRPNRETIADMQSVNRELARLFGNCQQFHGGPLESHTFLCMHEGKIKEFVEVIPGIHQVGADGLKHAAVLLNDGTLCLQDFRYYDGYAGWGLDQLEYEISEGFWYVAACSPALLKVGIDYHLWERVLSLMGGQYAELSKKPRSSNS